MGTIWFAVKVVALLVIGWFIFRKQQFLKIEYVPGEPSSEAEKAEKMVETMQKAHDLAVEETHNAHMALRAAIKTDDKEDDKTKQDELDAAKLRQKEAAGRLREAQEEYKVTHAKSDGRDVITLVRAEFVRQVMHIPNATGRLWSAIMRRVENFL